MTEPSSKSEVCQHVFKEPGKMDVRCNGATDNIIHDLRHPISEFSHEFEPQPPVSAPEKCPKCGEKVGFTMYELFGPDGKVHYRRPWGSRDLDGIPMGYSVVLCHATQPEIKLPRIQTVTDSAQPTPSEGPYHPAMDRLSVKFGPDEFQVKFSSPETVGTECILMNMGFAQGQASSAKEVEVYRKALEVNANRDHGFRCTYAAGKYSGTVPKCTCGKAEAMEALLTSKPEPVAQGHDGNCVPVRTPDDGWQCDCGYAPVAPVRKWEAEEEK